MVVVEGFENSPLALESVPITLRKPRANNGAPDGNVDIPIKINNL